MERLRALVSGPKPAASSLPVSYPEVIETACTRLAGLLAGQYGISARATALLLLQRDPGMWARVSAREPEIMAEAEAVVGEVEAALPQSPAFPIAVARQELAERLARGATSRTARPLRPDPLEDTGPTLDASGVGDSDPARGGLLRALPGGGQVGGRRRRELPGASLPAAPESHGHRLRSAPPSLAVAVQSLCGGVRGVHAGACATPSRSCCRWSVPSS